MCTTSDLSPPYTNDGTTEQTTDRTTIDREIYVVCRYCLILLSVCAVASENNDFLYFTFYWFPFISLCWNLSPASIAITKNERHNSTEDEGKNRNWIKKTYFISCVEFARWKLNDTGNLRQDNRLCVAVDYYAYLRTRVYASVPLTTVAEYNNMFYAKMQNKNK